MFVFLNVPRAIQLLRIGSEELNFINRRLISYRFAAEAISFANYFSSRY